MRILLSVVLASVLLSACSNEPPADDVADDAITADSIFTNARIYTLDAQNSQVQALAIHEGKILATGTHDEVMSFAGENTVVTDVEGRAMLPGIHDTHLHAALAGEQQRLQCHFLTNELEVALDTLKQCIADTPQGEWVRGGQWNEGMFPPGVSPKDILDEIAPEHPVFLLDWSWHNGWVNSKALEVLGIDDTTPNPNGGIIQRDTNSGAATGILLDTAAYNMMRKLPAYDLQDRADALQWALAQITQYGITTIKEAIVTQSIAESFAELQRRGPLPVRVNSSLTWNSPFAKSLEEELTLFENRADFATGRIRTDFAKIMLDGIPPTYTAAMLEPYIPNPGFDTDWRGELFFEPDELRDTVIGLDAQGISVKIHATGNRAVRVALDAFEAARQVNGNHELMHEVSHTELIHPDDIPRFAELNVAAEMCPILWYPIPGLDWASWIGPDHAVFPVKNLVDSGANVIYGSDWSVVPTPNPWPGIEAMVTRADPLSNGEETLWADQAVDLQTAIRIFTINSARANGVGTSSGSLEAGKDADFLILDRDIFNIPITDVSETVVLYSAVGGQAVIDKL